MKVIVKSPTKAILEDLSEQDVQSLTKLLTYTNTSISFQIRNHFKNHWWKQKDPTGWQEKLDEMQSKVRDCLLKQDSGEYWIRPGTIANVPMVAASTITSEVEYPRFRPFEWQSKPEFNPFDYQKQAVHKLMAVKHGNIGLPTGCGKSFILLLLAKNMGLNTVVVTPSKSIFNELLNEFEKRLGKQNVGGYGDGKKDIAKPITIAIGKSLTMLKEGTKAYEFFRSKQAVFVDESHTFAAEQLNDVCHGVLSDVPYRMFVSATQTRNDGTEKLLTSIIGENVLNMGLKDAIDQGYLCPLKFTVLATFSPDTRNIKDPSKCKRAHFLYNPNIASIAAKIANASWEVKKQSTLILVEELYQIELVIKLLKVPFAYVHSADKKKAKEFGLEKVNLQDSVDKFNNGEVKVLIGTKAIATGTNIFPTHALINWMGGASEIVTKQGSMGRATRKLEISKYKDLHSPKPFTMIYDFRIKGIDLLDKQLIKRSTFYKESGGEIRYF